MEKLKRYEYIILIGLIASGFVFYWFEPKQAKIITTPMTKFICPEDYQDQKLADADLYKFVKNYMGEHPNYTVSELASYRYSLLVNNHCQKTLDYIKNASSTENSLDSYTQGIQNNLVK